MKLKNARDTRLTENPTRVVSGSNTILIAYANGAFCSFLELAAKLQSAIALHDVLGYVCGRLTKRSHRGYEKGDLTDAHR